MSFAGRWLELEIIKLRKISQTQKDKYQMFFPHMQNVDFKKRYECKRGTVCGVNQSDWRKGKRRR
jgi:hypothetical protein